MDFAQQLTQQMKQVWKGLSPGRRLALGVMAAVCAAIVAGVFYWAAQPDYRVLYSGLSVEDAAAIAAKLQSGGGTYQLGAGGTTILVPAAEVEQRRLELAVDGLPAKGGKGFEIFDQSSPLGMTPFTQHVNYLRALQAELAKTIAQIEPVASARVHIVRPDPSPFVREQKPTTASVVLKLKPGATLNRQVAAGIVALVARSVEGLAQENVTLLDANGKLLSDPPTAEAGMIASQLEYRKELENELASKAEGMLAQVLGAGRAVVRVTADINFQHIHQKKETYNPDGRVATSEKVSTTKSSATGTSGKGGPAGTSSNLGRPAPAAGGGSNSLEETVQTDFAVSKVIQEFEDKIGNVERLTIAAMIDLSGQAAGAGFKLADAEGIIKQAVGFKTGRDEIKVSNVHLQPAVPAADTDGDWQGVQRWQTIISLVRNGSLGLAALVALIVGVLALRRLRPRPAPTEPTAQPAATEPEPAVLRLSAAADRDPEQIARILAGWLEQSDREQRVAA
jgi:flagellar M-ring protein FliF